VPEPGTYRKILDTDATRYGGGAYNRQDRYESQPDPTLGYPCHVRVDLPPLAALYLQLDR
jgi:1,4-alpha-glucan branching enzyme